jgi:DNA-binding NtrC family response regulator
MLNAARIMIVDDEPATRAGIRTYLNARGLDVVEAGTCAEASGMFRSTTPDAVVLDYFLPDGEAIPLLEEMRTFDPAVPVVILTGFGTIDLAVRAVKGGAVDVLTKPVQMSRLRDVVVGAIERRQTERKTPPPPELDLDAHIERLAASDSPVLVVGEPGTGKSSIARRLHDGSARARAPFVAVDAGPLRRDALERELFGEDRAGLVEAAEGGTLFLREIGDLDISAQGKLLKVLEEKRTRRVGDARDRSVDLRLIAGTQRDLRRATQEGGFRLDLYYRVAAVSVRLPPLRARKSEIGVLARTVLAEVAAELGRTLDLSPEAESRLASHSWPGNFRELRAVLAGAALLTTGRTIGEEHLRLEAGDADALGGAKTLRDMEREIVERVLAQENGHVEAAAKRLGVPRSTLYQRLKNWGLTPSRRR